VLLVPKAARTATGNGTSHDNGAATTNGAVAHQHVFAKSGTTPTLDQKIQHSSDNSTFVDLIAFSQKTAAGSERVAVTGAINRYTREAHTITGTTPSFTGAVSLARL
jgi:hypothetical protein